MSTIPNLAKSQIERLALLSEELGEAQQAIGKILRHGYESCHPDLTINNRQQLEKELGDVWLAIQLLCVTDLDEGEIDRHRMQKGLKVWKYLHHQGRARKFYVERWPHVEAEYGHDED